MATYIKQTYGTLVLAGLAAWGAFWYTGNDRIQVKARDYVEIIEGAREREMIVTSITKTNLIVLQIATNMANMVSLDSDILAIIPDFVDQTQIASWAASGSTGAPPHWTVSAIIEQALGLPNQVGLPPYGLQITKSNLLQRAKVLELMVYTDDTASWGDIRILYDDGTAGSGISYQSTNNYPGSYEDHLSVTNQATAESWWETNMVPYNPDWWQSSISASLTVSALSPTSLSGGVGGIPPYYAWSATASAYAGITMDASYYGSIGQNWWLKMWRLYYNTHGSWSSYMRSTKMNSTSRSIDLSRTDYYYSKMGLFESVFVTNNTASSTTVGYLDPANISWGSATASSYASELDPLDFHYNSIGGIDLSKSSTNTANEASNSGSGTNTVILNVIHKWDVTRCVE